MERCVIFCAGAIEPEDLALAGVTSGDYVIGADAGYLAAYRLGVECDLIVGDFDSSAPPADARAPLDLYPSRKDDTDCLIAVRKGLAHGCRDFVILGGLGGRLDHTMANFQTICFLAEQGCGAVLYGCKTTAMALHSGAVTLPSREGYLSIFAMGSACRGVTEEGLSYSLDKAVVTNTFPIGVSNRFTGAPAVITVEEGTLLIIMTDDQPPPTAI